MGEVKHDGGPAFPMPASETSIGGHYEQLGMSLRDWFAGQALAGIMAGLCSDRSKGDRAFDRVAFTHAAQDAFMVAGAMIAARTPSLHEGERG